MNLEDVQERSRYELRDGDRLLAWVDYRPAGDSVILAHTEVPEGAQGQGHGSRIVRAVLEDLRGRGVTAFPTCPFAAAFIGRHPEYADVVDPSVRGQFATRR